MMKFIDGPAGGQVLQLRRAPLLLRVVEEPAFEEGKPSKWDALDQLSDSPRMTERVHVYRLNGEAQSVHLCIRGKNRRAGGWYQIGEYVYHDRQPDRDTGRQMVKWRAWAVEEQRRLRMGQADPS
jgi:hypothetical protein